MKLTFERLLKIRKAEQPLLLLMVGSLCLFQFCQILNENFSETVFLKRYGVAHLPATFFFNSLAFLLLLILLNRVVDRMARTRIVSRLLVIFAAALVALRLLILSGVPLSYPVAYIAIKQMKYVFFIVFWTLATDIYSTRKARVLFPLIGGGGVVGNIAGSMLSGRISTAIGTDNILLLSSAGMLAAYVFVGLGRRRAGQLSPISFAPGEGRRAGSFGRFIRREVLQLRKTSLLTFLILLALLPGIIGPVFDYLFNYLADRTYASEASLIGFFGVFKGSFNMLILACQIFLAGGIFRRYGIVNVLLTYPLWYLVAFGSLSFSFTMITAIIGSIGLEVIDASLYKPGCQMLFNIVPVELRGRVSALVQGAVRRLGELAGSGLLWVLRIFISPLSLAAVGPIFAVIWLYCTLRLKRAYSSILYRSLSEKHVNFAELENRDLDSLITGRAREILLNSLSNDSGEASVVAARILSQLGVPGWARALCAGLPRRDAASQAEMVRLLGTAPADEVVRPLLDIADRLHGSVLPDAARILRRVAPAESEFIFRRWSESGVPRLVAESLLGLRAAGCAAGEERVFTWLESGRKDEVCSAIYLVGELGEKKHIGRFSRFVRAREPEIRAECGRAFGKLGLDLHAGDWKTLLSDSHPLGRLGALEGLEALGEPGAVDIAIGFLADEESAVRRAARSVIVSHGDAALPAVTSALPSAGVITRTALIGIIDLLGVKEQALLAMIDAKIEEAYGAVARMRAAEEISWERSRDILALLFRNCLDEAIDEIFRVLGMLLKGERVQFVFESCRYPDETVRGHALEAMEEMLAPDLSRRLIPLLEDLPLVIKCSAGARYSGARGVIFNDLLMDLLDSKDDAETICALMCVGEASEAIQPSLDARVSRARERLGMEGGNIVEELMDKVLTLKCVPIFSQLQFKELLAVASISREEIFRDGETIITQGERGFSMYIIISGRVRIVSRGNGEEIHLATLEKNDYFGEMALFDDSPRSASAIADGDVKVFTIDKREFRDMLREYPGVSIMICEEFCRRLRRTIEKASV